MLIKFLAVNYLYNVRFFVIFRRPNANAPMARIIVSVIGTGCISSGFCGGKGCAQAVVIPMITMQAKVDIIRFMFFNLS